jgi:6-phosphogluconolactonase
VNSAPIGDGGSAHIAVHPSDKFLLTAQYGGGSTAVFPIADDGSIQERSQLLEHEGGSKVVPRRQDGPHPHWVGFSPDGNYAFVPDLGLDKIVIYKINGQSLNAHSTAETIPGGGPRHMRFSVDGKYIYLLNELTLSVTTFAYDTANGTAKRLTTTKALSEVVKAKEAFNSSSEILVHPNGKFVYSANRGNDSVTVYHAEPDTGFLRVQEVEPVRGSWPRNINLDPTSNWLLAAGAHSNTISVFSIHQNHGELTFQTKNISQVPGCICILFGK